MKKNVIVEANPLMSENEMQQFVNENIRLVTPRTKQKFEEWSLSSKVDYIRKRIDWEKNIKESKENNKLENQVKRLMIKRKAKANDVHAVILMCQDFIKEMKEEEIYKIDEEIRRLQELKKALEG